MISTDLAASIIKHSVDQQADLLGKVKQARDEIERNKNTTSMLDCAEFYNNGIDTALAILDELIESEEN